MVSPYLYIGYYCNNNCIFCSDAGESEIDKAIEPIKPKSFSKIKKEIFEVRKKHDVINFMGKEPSLRKDILDILKFTTTNFDFRQVGITTNGRMLSYPKFAKDILGAGINYVGIPLSGASAKTHDKLTQVPGSFKQTVKGIYNIAKFKKPDVNLLVNLNLIKQNYFELKPMLDLVINLGVKQIDILNIAPLSRRSRTRKIIMKASELGKYVVNILNQYKLNSNVKFLLVEFPPCSLPKEARNYSFPCLEKNPNKVRIPLCKNCPYRDKCDGILQDYINLYGVKEFEL